MSVTDQIPAHLLDRARPSYTVILEYDVGGGDLPGEVDIPFLPPIGSGFSVQTERGGPDHVYYVAEILTHVYTGERPDTFVTLRLTSDPPQ